MALSVKCNCPWCGAHERICPEFEAQSFLLKLCQQERDAWREQLAQVRAKLDEALGSRGLDADYAKLVGEFALTRRALAAAEQERDELRDAISETWRLPSEPNPQQFCVNSAKAHKALEAALAAERDAHAKTQLDRRKDLETALAKLLAERATLATVEQERDRLRHKLNVDSRHFELECRKAEIAFLRKLLAQVRAELDEALERAENAEGESEGLRQQLAASEKERDYFTAAYNHLGERFNDLVKERDEARSQRDDALALIARSPVRGRSCHE